MTENNATQAGENLLDYAMAIAHERELDVTGHKHDSDGAVRRFKAAVERALLSKLRTEGVQAGAPVADSMVASVDAAMEEMKNIHPPLRRSDCERLIRASLASAPVAGEAQPAITLEAVDEYGPQLGWTKHWVEYPVGTKFYAAPQASEAVRNAALEEAAQAVLDDKGDSLASHAANRHSAARIRALKTQADKDGGDCAKGAGDVFGSPLTAYGLLARALRVATGTTLMQMARETGSTPAEISSYEFGRKSPDESWFERAAFFFASNGIVVAPTSLRKAHERAALAAQPGAQNDA